MAQRGHAEDCPGCEWESYCLRPEDAAWTGPPPAHRRQPPPVRPKPHVNAWFAVIWIGTVIPGLALPVLWLKLLGLAVFLLSVGFWLVHEISHGRRYRGCHWCTERAAREWPDLWAAWLEGQRAAVDRCPE